MDHESSESPNIGTLAAALAKAQGAMSSASKDSKNPHFNSKYADLASVWDACREPLSVNGLAVLQRPSTSDNTVRVTTQLVHASGEWVKDTITLTLPQPTAQALGSALTYLRRYGLSAVVGVAPDDDDGHAAVFAGKAEPYKPKTKHEASPSGKAVIPDTGTAPKTEPVPVASTPSAKPAPSKAAILCANAGHEWNLKGACGVCGISEKDVPAAPAEPKQTPQARARAVKVWKEATGLGWTTESFQAWTAQVLGHAKPSVAWHESEIGLLEAALEAEKPKRARVPGEEG